MISGKIKFKIGEVTVRATMGQNGWSVQDDATGKKLEYLNSVYPITPTVVGDACSRAFTAAIAGEKAIVLRKYKPTRPPKGVIF